MESFEDDAPRRTAPSAEPLLNDREGIWQTEYRPPPLPPARLMQHSGSR